MERPDLREDAVAVLVSLIGELYTESFNATDRSFPELPVLHFDGATRARKAVIVVTPNLASGNNQREAFASGPEDIFVELFAQVFGLANVQLLVHEYPVEDIYGAGRSIDYALRTSDERIAFEIDGLTWHLPGAIPLEKYEDDLLRQNSLIHLGWRVFRWTDRELLVEPERVKEQLALFLESIPGLLSFDDFLPKQTGDIFELRQHQKAALDSLAQMRADGKTIALLTHAQGAGKTIAAISDAKSIGGRTLCLRIAASW